MLPTGVLTKPTKNENIYLFCDIVTDSYTVEGQKSILAGPKGLCYATSAKMPLHSELMSRPNAHDVKICTPCDWSV